MIPHDPDRTADLSQPESQKPSAQEVRDSQGVQVGDHNTQNNHNYYPKAPLPAMESIWAIPSLSRIPAETALFVGRSRELRQLEQIMSDPGRTAVVAVHGPAGVGKSALAAQFAKLNTGTFDFQWWITADSPAAINTSLAELAGALAPETTELPREQRSELGIRWLATHDGWLLVLDNVTSPDLASSLLQRMRTGTVLMTSRQAHGWHNIATPVDLDVLNERDAVELMTRVVRTRNPGARVEYAAELCRELGFSPLAIEQAGTSLAPSLLPVAAAEPRHDTQVPDYPHASKPGHAVRRRTRRQRSSYRPMQIQQPMLFLGLGGTGAKVGAGLERRLRAELCGPDGRGLLSDPWFETFMPYQLPSCLQFVYADVSVGELQQIWKEAVPGREHDEAARKTMHLADLAPVRLDDFAEVAEILRINIDDQNVIDWLPSAEFTPTIGPLYLGTGQLPTVGRAALFETIRRNPDSALFCIRQAVSAINESGGDLFAVSGKQAQRADPITVFVVFSLAGGTGSGLFYDYLHLVGDLLRRGGKRAEIYPLVLMPSAFEGAAGGGRAAQLNAGSALADLFRLVDDQNSQNRFGQPATPELGVRYPHLGEIHLPAGTVKTALLFGGSAGVRADDVRRSMVSMMTMLTGAGEVDDGEGPRPSRSIADGFVNSQVERYAVAHTGVGRCGATTVAVAELMVPRREITDIVSARLVANAVVDLTATSSAESNQDLVRRFVLLSGLDPLLTVDPPTMKTLANLVGRDRIVAWLNERADILSAKVLDMSNGSMAMPASDFAPLAATTAMLREVDVFRLRRVLLGHPAQMAAAGRGGIQGLLDGWLSQPAEPTGSHTADPPRPGSFARRLGPRLRITDDAVQDVIRRQDSWYLWRTRHVWDAAWKDSQPWRATLEEINAIHRQFQAFADTEPQQFTRRSADLNRPRVGASYLLPFETGGLDDFYGEVLSQLRRDNSLSPDTHEGEIVNLLLGEDGWVDAYNLGRRDPDGAVAEVRRRVREAVADQLHPGADRLTLFPSLDVLLAEAVHRQDTSITEHVQRLREKLAGLVPGGFIPAGNGPLRVLFTYPAACGDREIERFLRREVFLPTDLVHEPEFRATQGEVFVVTATRTAMAITDVPEARSAIALWVDAQNGAEPRDMPALRRRFKPNSRYVLMVEADRVRVLNRLLCAAWGGRIEVSGDLSSPEEVVVMADRADSSVSTKLKLKLKLKRLGTLSSWASLLMAYESWILADDQSIRTSLAASIMSAAPADFARPPGPVFTAIVDIAATELAAAEEIRQTQASDEGPDLEVYDQFWRLTLPGALRMPRPDSEMTLMGAMRYFGLT
ncbi:tubulin-like doman-containing protein [Actinophytocola sp.]|uniref:tubulin-like doman-containing protein n=1 Tax=Actinophytocola sp. TaxID=1872138 RepID=UPI00389A1F5B